MLPYVLQAAKRHVVRMSKTYVSRLEAMNRAEDEWRAAAAKLSEEYQSLQRELSEVQRIGQSGPRIPGQVDPQVEAERNLFSTKAQAEVRTCDTCKQTTGRRHFQLHSLTRHSLCVAIRLLLLTAR